jgi:tetratricopeptide (TPR) repeat protein
MAGAPILGPVTEPPNPAGVVSWAELSERLRELRTWAGVSYREAHRRVVRLRRGRGVPELPAYNTVYRAMQPGRVRLDPDLIGDLAEVLLDDPLAAGTWRQAWSSVAFDVDGAAIVTVSHDLPAAPDHFSGRRAPLATLARWIADLPVERPQVCGVVGMAGVGKTTVAARAAQLAEPRFEVCLFADLRGSRPGLPAAHVGAVLDALLRALGVPGSHLHGMPVPARQALLDRQLAGRRAVIVLDDAASADQVRPLIPASGPTLVLVTSRHGLGGLPDHTLGLGELSEAEAMTLFRRHVGQDRVTAESEAATGVVGLAGRLPLAVALVAGWAATHPEWTLADQFERLSERRASLQLEDGVEVAFAASYHALTADRRRLLRLLSLHPGTDCDDLAAAACAGADRDLVRMQLRDLVEAHLIDARSNGRYEIHDLVRVFARARARDEEPARERRRAMERLLHYYRFATMRAMDAFAPQERARRPEIEDPGAATPEFAGHDAARAWLDTERDNLLATTVFADEQSTPTHTALMSRLLFRYLDVAGHYADAELLHLRASRCPDPVHRGHVLVNLGVVRATCGKHEAAVESVQSALTVFGQVGDRVGQARARTTLGGLYWRLSRYSDAVEHLRTAGEIYATEGDRAAEGVTYSHLGIVQFLRGDDEAALTAYQRAYAAATDCGDVVSAAHALINTGQVHARAGRLDQATENLQRGLALARERRNPVAQADGLNQLGAVVAQSGRMKQAIAYLREALDIARRYAVREIEVQIRDNLGRTLCAQRELTEAMTQHRRAIALATEIGDRYQQARAEDGLACVYAARERVAAAREHWERALAVFRELDSPDVPNVLARLAELDCAGTVGERHGDRDGRSTGGAA